MKDGIASSIGANEWSIAVDQTINQERTIEQPDLRNDDQNDKASEAMTGRAKQ
jgi:hypothetical protein